MPGSCRPLFWLAVALLVAAGVDAEGLSEQATLHCFSVKDDRKLRGSIDLSTFLGEDEGCRVGRARLYCAPAAVDDLDARVGDQPILAADIRGTDAGERVCYSVRCDKRLFPPVENSDVFSVGRVLTKVKPSLFCAPATSLAPSCSEAIPLCGRKAKRFRASFGPGPAPEAPGCSTPVSGSGTWYEVVGTGRSIEVDTCGEATDFAARISVYEGACGDLACVPTTEEACGNGRSVRWDSVEGIVYRVLVHGEAAEAGTFDLVVDRPGVCR